MIFILLILGVIALVSCVFDETYSIFIRTISVIVGIIIIIIGVILIIYTSIPTETILKDETFINTTITKKDQYLNDLTKIIKYNDDKINIFKYEVDANGKEVLEIINFKKIPNELTFAKEFYNDNLKRKTNLNLNGDTTSLPIKKYFGVELNSGDRLITRYKIVRLKYKWDKKGDNKNE